MNQHSSSAPAEPDFPLDAIMLQMFTGFQISQAVYVAAKLDIATILAEKGPRDVRRLAAEAGADADALGRVIRFLASLGVFRTDGDMVEITELGALLAAGPASYRYQAIYWMETHYAPFTELLHTVRTGEPAATRYYGKPYFDWITEDPERTEIQNRAFAAVTRSLRDGMFDGYQLPGGAVVADIGGADGAILARLLADDPGRTGIVFDRPEVVAAAPATIAEHGLAGRIQILGGDFFDSVPAADAYVLSWILHDWDDGACRTILGNIAKMARPEARLVVVESIMPTGDEPHLTRAADLTMLAMLSGRERTEDGYRTLLDSAGFTVDRIVPTPTPFSFIESTLR
jgi:hypothetical protein